MTATCLETEFEPLQLAHRDQLEPYLRRHPHTISGYTFAALFAWEPLLHYGWRFSSPETLLISWSHLPTTRKLRHLLQPVGAFPECCQEGLIRRAQSLDYPLRIVGVEKEFIDAHPAFCSAFDVISDPNQANYLYRAEDLARLPGKKYAKKRNHLSQAARQYQWTTEELTPLQVRDCFRLLEEIQREEIDELADTQAQELVALERTLTFFDALDQQGVLVRVEGRATAFAIFERLNPTTAVVRFERALRRYHGMSQVINRQVAQVVLDQGYELINREEDMGHPGLRKAKQSYYPIALSDAYELRFRP